MTTKYGSELFQLMLAALPAGARSMAYDLHAYGSSKESGADTSLATFSDQQRPLGSLVEDLVPGLTGAQILEGIQDEGTLNGVENDEEVAISTTLSLSFDKPGPGFYAGRDYFLPVLDMLCSPQQFKERMLNLQTKAFSYQGDPMLEFLREYRFTAMDTGQSLHLIGAKMIRDEDRKLEKFLAQALMFPSLGVDAAWVGHSVFRHWCALRISANKRPQLPTVNKELTELLRTFDLQGHMGQESTPATNVDGSGLAAP